MYAIIIAYILYINFASYYHSGTNFLNFLIKLFNNWVFRLIFLLIVGFFALDLFPYGGFIFAVLLTIAFLNTNMLVYKKQISESFLGGSSYSSEKKDEVDKFIGGSDASPYEQSYQEEVNKPDEYVTNDDNNVLEPFYQ
jgi:hypothetical protein